MRYLLPLLLVFTSACTGSRPSVSLSPEQVVENFVRQSAQVKSTEERKKLAVLCQGRMRQAIDKLSDDGFLVSYVNQPIRIADWKVIDTAIDGNLARVHYQITVENPNGQDRTQEVSEREVEMLRVGDQWYLEAIRPKGSDQIAFTRGMIF